MMFDARAAMTAMCLLDSVVYVVVVQAKELVYLKEGEVVLNQLPLLCMSIYILRTSTWGRCVQEHVPVVACECGVIIITDLQHTSSILRRVT